jgi:hypothetical protein
LTAEGRYRCLKAVAQEINPVNSKYYRFNEIHKEAVSIILKETQFLFSGEKFFVGRRIQQFLPGTFLAVKSVPKNVSIYSAMNFGRGPMTDQALREFIKLTMSSYAVFPLQTRGKISYYVVYITDEIHSPVGNNQIP